MKSTTVVVEEIIPQQQQPASFAQQPRAWSSGISFAKQLQEAERLKNMPPPEPVVIIAAVSEPEVRTVTSVFHGLC